MCSGLVGWEKLTWPSVWPINNMASQPPAARSGWELENCILSSLQREEGVLHRHKNTSEFKTDTKLSPAGSGYDSYIRFELFVPCWAQRGRRLLYACRGTHTHTVTVQWTLNLILNSNNWFCDLPWVNQRSFCIAAMSMRASGLASSNLDNKPERRSWERFLLKLYDRGGKCNI